MKLGIDAREIEKGVCTGIGRALSVFLDYFERQNDDNGIVLFSTRPVGRPDSPRIRNVVTPPTMTLIWDQVVLPRLIRKANIDLFYSTYYKIPIFSSCPCVATIYDVMYLTFPIYREKALVSSFYYKTFGKMMVDKASYIVTSSKYSKKDIMSLFNVPDLKVSFITLGLPALFRPASSHEPIERVMKKLGIDRDYVLYAGNFKPHKNVPALITAFSMVRQRFPDLALVLAGPRDRHFSAISREIKGRGMNGCVVVPGAIEETDLPALYAGACLFVMPSLYEGFGFPPLEAMACGTPVVCSNATSLPEVVGDAAILVDANFPEKITEAILQVIESPELARSLSEKGVSRAGQFTGDRYAGSLYGFLKTCVT
jgi:glycosyltransferase involved in cell wall biosynthesis